MMEDTLQKQKDKQKDKQTEREKKHGHVGGPVKKLLKQSDIIYVIRL